MTLRIRSPRRRRFSARLRLLGLAVVLLLPGRAFAQASGSGTGQGPTVQAVDIVGNRIVQKETLLYYVSTKPGDVYDELRVRDDFRRLWDTGFLKDLVLDVRNAPGGQKVVIFRVDERPRVQIVDYRGSKALTTTAIEDKLKEKDAQLRIDSFYEAGKAKRVEEIIREMLAEKGRLFATVRHESKNVGMAGTQVSFIIEDGPKAKVKDIVFSGNTVFDDGDLKHAMKKIKEKGFFNLSWLTGKNSYTEEKWAEDHESLQNHYLNRGYVTATVGEPQLTYSDGVAGFFRKKPVKWITLTIPVTEGDRYKVGKVEFAGMTVLKPDVVRELFKVHTGDVYNDKKIQKGYEKLRDIYGSLGYFQWTGTTKRTPDHATKVVDVTLQMDEDKQYFVGRIAFTGNDTTRDKVVRREVYMNESDVFNTEALKLSIKRINQLGYFKPMEGPPELSQSDLGEDKLDVTFKLEEQNRNQFTFGAGVSGLEGTFVNASFSTSNFLGLGETFQIYAQSGKRTRNYQIAITEPYLFDRPITAGIDIFHRRLNYESFENQVGYRQEGTGGSGVIGLPLGRFTRLFGNYSYEMIDISGLENFAKPNTLPEPGEPVVPIFNVFTFGEEGRRYESRLTPSIVHNTVDNPYTPRSGVKWTTSLAYVGGPLGGTVSYLKPDMELVLYLPHTRKTALGLRVEGAYLRPFGDTEKLRYDQRFFLGGETQIRGTNIRTVTPVGNGIRLGGNKYVLFNAEYYFDIGGPLRALIFFDAGGAYLEKERISLDRIRTSAGAELRFVMPVLNVPFRLIYAFNPNRDDYQPKSTFKFAVGTTF
jgi:outer membrane protein insertion porin family